MSTLFQISAIALYAAATLASFIGHSDEGFQLFVLGFLAGIRGDILHIKDNQ